MSKSHMLLPLAHPASRTHGASFGLPNAKGLIGPITANGSLPTDLRCKPSPMITDSERAAKVAKGRKVTPKAAIVVTAIVAGAEMIVTVMVDITWHDSHDVIRPVGYDGPVDALQGAVAHLAAEKLPNVAKADERGVVGMRGPSYGVSAEAAVANVRSDAVKAGILAARAVDKARQTEAAKARQVAKAARRLTMPSTGVAQELNGQPTTFNYKRLSVNGEVTCLFHAHRETILRYPDGTVMETRYVGPRFEVIEKLDYSLHANKIMRTKEAGYGMPTLRRKGVLVATAEPATVATDDMSDELFGTD